MKINLIFAFLTICQAYDLILDKKKLCEQSGIVDKEAISLSDEDIQFGRKVAPKSIKFKIFEDLCKDENDGSVEDYKIEDEEMTFSQESMESTRVPLLKETTSATMRNYLVTPKIVDKKKDDILSTYGGFEEWLGNSKAKNDDLDSNRKHFENKEGDTLLSSTKPTMNQNEAFQKLQIEREIVVDLQGDCPEGWYDGDDGRCLKFQLNLVPYYVAQANCKIMGARLHEPPNFNVHDMSSFYFHYFSKKKEPYWIGIKYDKEKKEYVYDSSGKPLNETIWHKNHPIGPHECVETTWKKGVDYSRWVDTNCAEKRYSLCELDRGKNLD